MNFIWAPLTQNLMHSIEVTQRKALRIVLKKSWYCSKSELYNIKILPVSALCNVSTCLQMFKITRQLTKNNIQITTASQFHQHTTRHRENFVARKSNTVLGSQTFYIRGLNLFNSLPQDIKKFNSISIFKNRIREHFFEIYCSANNINI